MSSPTAGVDSAAALTPLPLRRGKRAFDIVFGLVAIGVLSPLFAVTLLAMALDFLLTPADRGPWLYREPRIGRGRLFTIYKFRIVRQSVLAAARAAPGGLPSLKPLERQPESLTRTGHYLKAFYLDELPQLFNILLGDMTLVGPRPWPPDDYRAQLAEVAATKGRVPCGMAGPVQTHKGERIDYHQLERDYVHAYATFGPWALLCLDLRHLWGALRIMLQGKGL